MKSLRASGWPPTKGTAQIRGLKSRDLPHDHQPPEKSSLSGSTDQRKGL